LNEGAYKVKKKQLAHLALSLSLSLSLSLMGYFQKKQSASSPTLWLMVRKVAKPLENVS